MQIQAFDISGIELLIPRHIGDVPVLQDDETLNEGGYGPQPTFFEANTKGGK